MNIIEKIFEKTKTLAVDSDNNVCIRFYPLMGVNPANEKIRLEKLLKNLGLKGTRLLLSIAELKDFSKIHSITNHTLINRVTLPQITFVDSKFSGNYLIMSYPDSSDFKRNSEINFISALLRINFGNFIVWPAYHKFHINLLDQSSSLWHPMEMPNLYEPVRDGPFIGNDAVEREDFNICFGDLYQKFKSSEEVHFINLIGAIIKEAAAAENDIGKKIYLYWSAIDSISEEHKEVPFIKFMAKGYFKGKNSSIDDLIKFIKNDLLIHDMRLLRHDVIHNGYKPQNLPLLERYLQLLILELIIIRVKMSCGMIIERFIKANGVSWYDIDKNRIKV